MIEDGASSGMKPAERNRPEVDGPDVVGDLLEPYVLAAEQMGDDDARAGTADGASAGMVVSVLMRESEHIDAQNVAASPAVSEDQR